MMSHFKNSSISSPALSLNNLNVSCKNQDASPFHLLTLLKQLVDLTHKEIFVPILPSLEALTNQLTLEIVDHLHKLLDLLY